MLGSPCVPCRGKNWAEALCGEKPWPNNTGPFVSRWQGLIVTEGDVLGGALDHRSRNAVFFQGGRERLTLHVGGH